MIIPAGSLLCTLSDFPETSHGTSHGINLPLRIDTPILMGSSMGSSMGRSIHILVPGIMYYQVLRTWDSMRRSHWIKCTSQPDMGHPGCGTSREIPWEIQGMNVNASPFRRRTCSNPILTFVYTKYIVYIPSATGDTYTYVQSRCCAKHKKHFGTASLLLWILLYIMRSDVSSCQGSK